MYKQSKISSTSKPKQAKKYQRPHHKRSLTTKPRQKQSHRSIPSTPQTVPRRQFFLFDLFKSGRNKDQKPTRPTPQTHPELFVLGRFKTHAAQDLVGNISVILPGLENNYALDQLNQAGVDIGDAVFHDICASSEPSLLQPNQIISSSLQFIDQYLPGQTLVNPNPQIKPLKFKRDVDFSALAHIFQLQPKFLIASPMLSILHLIPPPTKTGTLSSDLFLDNPDPDQNSAGFVGPLTPYTKSINKMEHWDRVCDVLDVINKGIELLRTSQDYEATMEENSVLNRHIAESSPAYQHTLLKSHWLRIKEGRRQFYNRGIHQSDLDSLVTDRTFELMEQYLGSGWETNGLYPSENDSELSVAQIIDHDPEMDKIAIIVTLLKEMGWLSSIKEAVEKDGEIRPTAKPAFCPRTLATLSYLRPSLTSSDRNLLDNFVAYASMDPLQLEVYAKSLLLNKFAFLDVKRGVDLDPIHYTLNSLSRREPDQILTGPAEGSDGGIEDNTPIPIILGDEKNPNVLAYRFAVYSLQNAVHETAVSYATSESESGPDRMAFSVPLIADGEEWRVLKTANDSIEYDPQLLPLPTKLNELRNRPELIQLDGDEVRQFKTGMEEKKAKSQRQGSEMKRKKDVAELGQTVKEIEDRVLEFSQFYLKFASLEQHVQIGQRKELVEALVKLY